MTTRDGLTVLQQAAQKATGNGWTPNGAEVLAIDYILEPPSIVIHTKPVHGGDSGDVYFAEYFPLFENTFALAFFGKHLAGDGFFGTLPAWQYHQHRLLFLLQWNCPEQFFEYIQSFL